MGSLFTEVWQLCVTHLQMGKKILMVTHYLSG